MLYTIAFTVLSIGTRSPKQLVADIKNGFRQRAAFLRGLLRFAIGAIAVAAGSIILSPAMTSVHNQFIEILPIVTALIVEQLIGPDLRARYR